MDQAASSEVEELEANYRLLDEKRRRLEAQKEQSLQQAIDAYESGQTTDQEEINRTELELNEFKAELRSKEEAVHVAYQHKATRKRKHEVELQQLKQELSTIKRLNQSNTGFQGQPDTPRSSVQPSALTRERDQRTPAGHASNVDGASDGPPEASYVKSPVGFLDESYKVRDGLRAQNYLDSESFDLLQPGRDDKPEPSNSNATKPDVSEVDATADNNSSLLQAGASSDEDEYSDFSIVEEPSAEDLKTEHMAEQQLLPLQEKTISYDEVFQAAQDPQAKYKHWIVEYPKGCGSWYILRCLKHNLNWYKNPLPAAGKHITGRGHTCLSKKASLAIEELGERVTGCDQQKAEASNAEYDKAVAQGYKPSNVMKNSRPDKGQNSQEATDPQSDNEQANMFEGVVDPIVGEVYQAWWDSEPRSWYLVVVLPYFGSGDWEEIGIRGNLFTSGLAKEIPSCFKIVKVAKDSGGNALRLTWAKGYEDGGPHVRARRFPCLFLHSPLKILPADQEFAIGHEVEVLAFRTAQQLRHRSTALPPTVCKDGVDDYQSLARDFEARLRTIRAKQDPAPGKEIQDAIGAGTSSIHDQQQANDIISVKATEKQSLPADFCVEAGLVERNTGDRPTIAENGQGELSDHFGLAHRNPRVILPSYDMNSFVAKYGSSNGDNVNRTADNNGFHSPIPLSSTPGLSVVQGREAGPSKVKFSASEAPSRKEQPKGMMKRQDTWPNVWQLTSSTDQTTRREEEVLSMA
ncbi:hypothetical protein Daus18300_014101 [Diaporthe australafricana]|uniref:Uncharacterized protein n=1 Tax=Diaporthe australafricana TaxID=127596 RepID=A0ABR3VWJ8_9PEZI